MTGRLVVRCALLFTPVLLLGACGSQHTAQQLDDRLQAHLAPQVAAGRAVVQPVHSGVRVTLMDLSVYPNDKPTLNDVAADVRADVIEGMLNPTLMQVQVADTSTLPEDQRIVRVSNVQQYFIQNGLELVLSPADQAAADGPAGLVITINVRCPPSDGIIGYRDGLSRPVCE